MDDLTEHRKNTRAGGKYRTGSSETEESADESAEWGGEDTKESASEEEAATELGAGEAGRPLTATVGATEESGADGRPGGAAAGGGDAGEAISTAADKAGAGDRHGANTVARDRISGRRENPAGKSYGVGG